ncbi:helix-turn-helix transcriptional regulator [Priestia aryabhattai]|uniref:helix-turn-helix domain-containing protein n=1 Tax=Priestia aryabhattai TaxID=412384 RepID=UPI001C8D03CC|nr:helix-turn-helix transcriptional regulator [Priestia aryabhattai]MBY0078510.1 helix-turn-helix transcriptional regulator [Priestia aryabhattai]
MDKLFKDNWLEQLKDRVEDMAVVDLLRIQRTVDELDLTDFENITGVARSTVSKVENRKRTMSQAVYYTILAYLDGHFDDKIKAYKQN